MTKSDLGIGFTWATLQATMAAGTAAPPVLTPAIPPVRVCVHLLSHGNGDIKICRFEESKSLTKGGPKKWSSQFDKSLNQEAHLGLKFGKKVNEIQNFNE